jgi:hypothetical protein
MTAHRAASIRARLKQYTDRSKQDFNLAVTQYGLERRSTTRGSKTSTSGCASIA